MAAKKDDLSNAILDAVLRNVTYTSPTSVFAALYTVAPDATTQGTEVSDSGTAYTRMGVTFAAAASGAASNSGSVTWAAATASFGTVAAVAICESAVVGTDDQLYFGALSTPTLIDVGDEANFAIGALVVTES